MISGFNVRLFLRTMVNSGEEKPTELAIRKKLQDALNPKHLEILNESYMHNVPKGSETHFKVLVVSDKFNDQTLIKVKFNKTKFYNFLGIQLHYIFILYIVYKNFSFTCKLFSLFENI